MFWPVTRPSFDFASMGKLANRDLTSIADRVAPKAGSLAHSAVALAAFMAPVPPTSLDGAIKSGALTKLHFGAMLIPQSHADAAYILGLCERFVVIYDEERMTIYLHGTIAEWLNLYKNLSETWLSANIDEIAKKLNTYLLMQGFPTS